MNMLHGARLEIQRLKRKLSEEDRAFKAGAPPLDADGLPIWDDAEPLTTEGYAKALDGGIPDDDLTEAELATRERLSPYREVFARLERAETEEEDTVT